MRQLTTAQQNNFTEWLDSRKEATGENWSQSIKVFNSLSAADQQYVISKRWYRVKDGQRINRPLTPCSVGAE